MKVFDKLIKVSKASINEKVFGKEFTRERLEAELQGEELEKALALLPTEEEQDFMDIFKSQIAGLARLQRKMSVCLDVEVIDLEDDRIRYEYADKLYEIREPKNAFRICTQLEKSSLDAFVEVCKQKCFSEISKEGTETVIEDVKKDGAIKLDALNLAVKVCDKFFFQTFIL
jgi:hypothetical protein